MARDSDKPRPRGLSSVAARTMDLKFPAHNPDQTLCCENKRRIIGDKHAAWMAQRDRALASEEPQPEAALAQLRASQAPDRVKSIEDGKREPEERAGLRGTLDDVHRQALQAVGRYDDEKKQLAGLPPARRAKALAEKRASWMEQRGRDGGGDEVSPSSDARAARPAAAAARRQQPAVSAGAAAAATPVVGEGNIMLAALHAERRARESGSLPEPAALSRPLAPGASAAAAAPLADLVASSRQAGAAAARSLSLSAQAASSAPSAGATGAWSCGACTFHHTAFAPGCEVCGTPRPSPEEQPVVRPSASLDAELGLDDSDGEGSELGEIEDFLAAVELDLAQDD